MAGFLRLAGRIRLAILAVSFGAVALMGVGHAQTVPAFSGADGAGATVTGGRGGTVYHVTVLDSKLADTTPGTFQYGLSHATGPTTIVFDVGGTIWLGLKTTDVEGWDTQNTINIPANVTVAGQTAPGGITIMGGQVKFNGKAVAGSTLPVANDIFRDVTLAAGYGMRKANSTSGYYDQYVYDNVDVNSSGVMLDHVTALFSTDESISSNEMANNTTVQYTTIAQGQSYPQQDAEGTHTFDAHALGDLWSMGSNAVSTFSHDLYANTSGRIPAIQTEEDHLTKDGSGNYIPAYTDFRNNVVYNWYGTAGYGSSGEPGAGEFEGNYYKVGPGGDGSSNNSTDYGIYPTAGGTTVFTGSNSTMVYQNGGNTRKNLDGTTTTLSNSNYSGSVFEPSSYFSSIPYNGITDSAPTTYNQVLNYVGANWQNRDTIDQRLVYDTINGVGKIAAFDDPNGGFVDDPTNPANDKYVSSDGAGTANNEWNTLLSLRGATNGGTGGTGAKARGANYDTDQDGMPDIWEAAMGTSPTIANNNGNVENNGYTDLENYLNEVAAFPASAPIVFGNGNGTGRYAEIGNWQTGVFEPSRYDTAQVDTGTVTVDVPGQHAGTLSVATTSGTTATLAVTNGWIDVAQNLLIGPLGAGAVNQTGGLVRAGNAVVIGGSNHAGTYTLGSGTLATPLLTKGSMGGIFNFNGGMLHADVITFNLTNNGGVLAPGSDLQLQTIAAASMPDINDQVEQIRSLVGTTHVEGSLTLQSGALQIDLASLSSNDFVAVDSQLILGGSLDVVTDNGYSPTAGSLWEIGSASGGITGSFASVTSGFQTEVIGSNLFLTMTSVPEPTSIALLSIAGFGLLRRRR